MLLELYERAILAIQGAEHAQASDRQRFAEKFLQAQKCLLAIQAGLQPNANEIAFNIARLIHFASSKLSDHQFDAAATVLQSIRSGFEAIRDEATRLEKDGVIPPLDLKSGINALA